MKTVGSRLAENGSVADDDISNEKNVGFVNL